MPTISSISLAFFVPSALEQCSCRRTTSAICSPTRMMGLSAVIGSWKIMEISLPRIFCISSSRRVSRFLPSKTISPEGTRAGGSGRMRRIARAMDVFPAPVSPTRPMVLPRARSKDT